MQDFASGVQLERRFKSSCGILGGQQLEKGEDARRLCLSTVSSDDRDESVQMIEMRRGSSRGWATPSALPEMDPTRGFRQKGLAGLHGATVKQIA